MARLRQYCGPCLLEINQDVIREYCGRPLYQIEGFLDGRQMMALIIILFAR